MLEKLGYEVATANDGQQADGAEAGQVASLTSANNFINFCATVPDKQITNGKQVTETKTWKYFHLSDFSYMTFVQVQEAAREVAGGLLKLDVKKTDILNVYAATRYVFSPSSYGAGQLGQWRQGC